MSERLHIAKIHEGIVIDHIKAGKALQIYQTLGLDQYDCPVAILTNVDSRAMRRKDILKIDRILDFDFDLLAYWDKHITVNIIRDGEVDEKITLQMPKTIRGIITCQNPRCITTEERQLEQIFYLANEENSTYRCQYCEMKHDSK